MINPNDKSRIIERIKSLFALGDSSRNPYEEEVKTALKMAQDLMKKYNLTISEIDFKNASDDKMKTTRTQYMGHLTSWKYDLAMVMKILFNVEPLIENVEYHYKRVIFVGFPIDCELATYSYNYLHDLIEFRSKLKYKGRRLERQAYLQGFLDCLLNRARKEKELNIKPEDIKYGSLVVVKTDRINKWISDNLKTKKAQPRWQSNLENMFQYNIGYNDAKRVKLNNKKELKRTK